MKKQMFGQGIRVKEYKPMLKGWMCPRCKRVWSPYRASCNCKEDTEKLIG